MLSFINGTDDMMGLFTKNKDSEDEKLRKLIDYDPETQYAVIKSSICTGEKVAGFKNKKDGHFVEVMLIRTPQDEERFKRVFDLSDVKVEY